jgi:hypothetical protein
MKNVQIHPYALLHRYFFAPCRLCFCVPFLLVRSPLSLRRLFFVVIPSSSTGSRRGSEDMLMLNTHSSLSYLHFLILDVGLLYLLPLVSTALSGMHTGLNMEVKVLQKSPSASKILY